MFNVVILIFIAAFGCKSVSRSPDSEVKIAGGVDMGPPGNFATIVKFTVFKGVDHRACTATFIRPAILLTAAHCVVGEDLRVRPINHITLDTRFASVVEVHVAPGYLIPNQTWENQIRHDLAWIRVNLPEDDLTDPRHLDHIWKIADVAPKPGALLRMIGYGMISKSKAAPDENAREGFNYIDEVDENFIHVTSKASVTKNGDVDSLAKANDANTLWGDSGGPAMVAGQLVGVTSNGGIGFFTALTRFINLNGPIGRAFLNTVPN